MTMPIPTDPALMSDDDFMTYVIDKLQLDGIWRKLMDRIDDPASHLPILSLMVLVHQHSDTDLKRIILGLKAFGAPALPVPAMSAAPASSLTG